MDGAVCCVYIGMSTSIIVMSAQTMCQCSAFAMDCAKCEEWRYTIYFSSKRVKNKSCTRVLPIYE